MFSSLSSYIWASEPDQTVPDSEIETKEFQAEDEWVLVDVVSRVAPTEKKLSDNYVVPESNTHTRFATIVEESWYITPPSCFNASQTDSSTLETSPFENLLIEHPSMSVYGSPEPDDSDLQENDEYTFVLQPELEISTADSGTVVDINGTVEQAQIHTTHRRVLGLVDKVDLLAKRVQKTVAEQAKSKLKKKTLEHTNKTHDRTSHSKRKRKQLDRKQGKHSGVYSNRGC